MHKLKTLTLAMAGLIVAGNVTAKPLQPEAVNRLGLIQSEAPFLKDADLQIKLRGVYYERDGYKDHKNRPGLKGAGDSLASHDAALGYWADFKSGWIADTVGLDLGYYGSVRLHGGGDLPYVNKLYDSKGLNHHGKLGVVNLKLKVGDKHRNLHARIGRMQLSTPLLSTDFDETTPGSFQGVYLNGRYDMVSGYAGQFDRFSAPGSNGMDKIAINGQELKRTIAGFTVGGKKKPSFGIHYSALEDYLETYMYRFTIGKPIGGNLYKLDLQYYTQDADKLYYDKKHDSSLFAANLFGVFGNLKSFVSYSKVGDKSFDLMHRGPRGSGQPFGPRVGKTSQHMTRMIWNDFNHAEMQTVALGGFYNMKGQGMPELTLLGVGAYGWGADLNKPNTTEIRPLQLNKSHGREMVVGATYEVLRGDLQGLWVNLTYNRSGGGYVNHHGGRLVIDYTVSLF